MSMNPNKHTAAAIGPAISLMANSAFGGWSASARYPAALRIKPDTPVEIA